MKKNKKISFVNIKPHGFYIDGTIQSRLVFSISRITEARKLWSTDDDFSRFLVCFSSNGKYSRDGRSCAQCTCQDLCLRKLRIFFQNNNHDYCLEIPFSSVENFYIYLSLLQEDGFDVKDVTTMAVVIDRGYWGEVCFSKFTEIST